MSTYWRWYDRVELAEAVVLRRGRSRSLWSYEAEDDARCDAIVGLDGDEEEAVGIRFSISVPGGGRTNVLVRLGPDEMVSLMKAAVQAWDSADRVILAAVRELLLRHEEEEATRS